jgi:hypothetical protein
MLEFTALDRAARDPKRTLSILEFTIRFARQNNSLHIQP